MGSTRARSRRGAHAVRLSAIAAVVAAASAACGQASAAPTAAQCAALRATREAPPVESLEPAPGAVRVFAIQYKQEVRDVVSYTAYRNKIECLIRADVVPHLLRGHANVVALDEDVGLATIATGSRGGSARAIAENPPSCESEGAPCGTLAALGALDAGYSRQLAAYRTRFPDLSALSGVFVAATDTFVRGFMQTFSDLARRYGVYILGSNTQAPFRESSNPSDIDAFADPDLPRPRSVYVATAGKVYDEAFLWAPHDVRASGPAPERNLVETNLKVPLTSLEQELDFSPGPSSGPAAVANLHPYRLPGTSARLGFATSLPAFAYGDPPAGVDPCSDTASYYMRCLDRLGANVVIQDDANPGRWAGTGSSYWQPLEWMQSTYRAVADPSVHFRYDVNPMMVGNLADLAFDGQTGVTARTPTATRCNYVGDASLQPADGDPPSAGADAGAKQSFLGLAPWVIGRGSRSQLRQVGAKLAPGSHDPLENDYVETAVVADLTFPGARGRRGCTQGMTTRLTLRVHPRVAVVGRRTRFRFTVSAGGRRWAGALVTFAGRRVRTDARGVARITLVPSRWRRAGAAARADGARPGHATVRFRASRRPVFSG